MCLLKYVLNCEQHFFIFDISIRIDCNRNSEGLLYFGFWNTIYLSENNLRTSADSICALVNLYVRNSILRGASW
jgi:hypothetical protein